MSYGLSITGHGVPSEKVKAVFETAVRELRSETSDDGAEPSGSAWGDGYSQNAADVTDGEPDETAPDETEAAGGEG